MPPQPRVTTTSEPLRTCVGCRNVRPVSALIRLRLTAGRISADRRGQGRGAWLCATPRANGTVVRPECLSDAASSGAFSRAFRRRVDQLLIDDLIGRMSLIDDGGRVSNRR